MINHRVFSPNPDFLGNRGELNLKFSLFSPRGIPCLSELRFHDTGNRIPAGVSLVEGQSCGQGNRSALGFGTDFQGDGIRTVAAGEFRISVEDPVVTFRFEAVNLTVKADEVYGVIPVGVDDAGSKFILKHIVHGIPVEHEAGNFNGIGELFFRSGFFCFDDGGRPMEEHSGHDQYSQQQR